MREILFRGKRLDNGKWIQGYFFQIWEQAFILWGTTNGVPNMIEVNPLTVGQFTGLCDKNGKKIFEGDIIRYSDGETLEIAFDGRTVQFTAKDRWLWTMVDVCEVIGTIYDKEEKC